MADITSFSGAQLLEQATVDAIKREAAAIVARADVAGAWKGAGHLKKELSLVPQEKVQSVLPEYRRIVAKLKALSLPLLDEAEVKNLLQNNLAFLEDADAQRLAVGLSAWLAMQEGAEREKLLHEFSALAPGLFKEKGSLDDDEQREIEDHAKLAERLDVSSAAIDADSVAEKIAGLASSVPDKASFVRRGRALVESRLRDVRTSAQLSEYLRRPLAVGGLGLSEEAAEQAGRLVEQAYQGVHASPPPAPKTIPVAPSPRPSSAPSPELVPTPPPAPLPVKPLLKLPTSPPPPPAKAAPAPAAPVSSAEVKPAIRRSNRPTGGGAEGKRRLDDIAPKTVSPSQQLATLTIDDFRSFGDAAAASERVLAMVGNISETLADRLAAIDAFRQSPFFRQYLALGRASLSQGKKLAEVLADSAVNPDTMTEDEFFTIASLNTKMK